MKFFSARNGSPGNTPSCRVLSDGLRIPNRLIAPVGQAERLGARARSNTGAMQRILQDEKALLEKVKLLISQGISKRKKFCDGNPLPKAHSVAVRR